MLNRGEIWLPSGWELTEVEDYYILLSSAGNRTIFSKSTSSIWIERHIIMEYFSDDF